MLAPTGISLSKRDTELKLTLKEGMIGSKSTVDINLERILLLTQKIVTSKAWMPKTHGRHL